MRRSLLQICMLAGCTFTAAATADVLWSQPQVNSFGGLSSQDARNPGGLGWFSEVADNFVGQTGWNVDQVEFYGGYATPLGQEGHTEGFTIRFYTDNGGHPGTRIFEQDVFSFTETNYYVHPSLGFAGYQYSVSLSPAFNISSDATYWVSVVAILPRGGTANEPQWGWIASSTTTLPHAHQWFFSPGNFTEQGNDVAYSLLSSGAVPCTGDLDSDGTVSLSDLAVLLSNFGLTGTTPEQGDLDGDSDVDIQDLATLLANFGFACP
ncbi:MAG: hypothetical protein HZB38_03755 [Planctomycetes bacterium]|nr:hypothetical protein [Planctomycetota bacterium]